MTSSLLVIGTGFSSQSVDLWQTIRMFTLKAAITLVLCLETTAANRILLTNIAEHTCLMKVLSEIIKDDKSLAITWSHHTCDVVKDDILTLFKDKAKFIFKYWKDETGTLRQTKINIKPEIVLILASKVTDIFDGISSLHNKDAWSEVSKFVVIFLRRNGRLQSTSSFLKTVFQTFADLNAMDVHVIYKVDEDGTNEFTWFHSEDSNCDAVNRFRLISQWGFHRILPASNVERGCAITVAVQSSEPYSGDAEFLKKVEMNLLKKFAKWSHRELKAIEGADLREKNFDVIIGATNDVDEKSMQSTDFHFDVLTWCVKRSDFIQSWRNFYMIASWQVWIVVVLGNYFIGATVFCFFRNYHHPENIHYCCALAVLSMLAVPVPYNPTNGLARIHFGFILIYGLLCVTFINCFFMSLMTKPLYEHQIHTVDELMNYEYKILVDVSVVKLHHLGNDEISAYTKANHENCNGMVQCLNQLLDRVKIAAIVPRKFAEKFVSTTKHPIFCFPESFKIFTRTVSLSRPNSNLLNRTNFFIRQTFETGLLLKWEIDDTGRQKYALDWNVPANLTLKHYHGVAILTGSCLLISFLAFIAERMTYANIKKGNRCGRVWKILDKLALSPERVVFRKDSPADF